MDTTTNSFLVVVFPVNDPPTVRITTPAQDAIFRAGQTISVLAEAMDADGRVAKVDFYAGATHLRESRVDPYSVDWRGAPVGTHSLTAVATDNEGLTTVSLPVVIMIISANSAPSLSTISNQTTLEDTPTQPIAFTVSDGETPVANLQVTAASSNLALVPSAGLTLGGSGTNRTITLTPARDQFGMTTVTLIVRDAEGLAATNRFDLTVTPVNDAPTLDIIPDRTVDEDAPEQTINLTGITAGPVNEVQVLTVTASSDNPSLIPNPSVTYASPAPTGTLRFRPLLHAHGVARLTVTARDNGGTANGGVEAISRTFTVTVRPVNDLPTISDIPNQTGPIGQATAVLPFMVNDLETAAADLRLSIASSNATLAPTNNIVLGGSGSSRTAQLTPAPGQSGSVTITVTVTDADGGSASDVFTVTVQPAVIPEMNLPEGDILIIRNFAEPKEIDQLVTWAQDTPLLVDNLGTSRKPVVVVADQEGLKASHLVKFRLVIWNDLGEAGLRDVDVEILHQAWAVGLPIYFIGEKLANPSLGSAAQASWRALVGLSADPVPVEPGRVMRQEPITRINDLFSGSLPEIDLVQDFDYPHPLTLGNVTGGGEVRATLSDVPVLIQYPHGDAAETEARRLVQSFLVTPGLDESVKERRKLFLNGIKWLLGDQCQYFSATPDCSANENLPPQSVCRPFKLSAVISNTGRCEAGGVIVTNTVAEGLEIVSTVIRRSNSVGTNTGFVERRGRTVVYGLGTVRTNSPVEIETWVLARRPGEFTNQFVFRANSRPLEVCTSVVQVEGVAVADLRLEIVNTSPDPTLTLRNGCGDTLLQSSTNLLDWTNYRTNTAALETIPVALLTGDASRFFRVVPHIIIE